MNRARATRHRLLADLYGPERAGPLLAEIDARLAARGAPARPASPWDQRDAWLIAYPDHVQAPYEAPLRTLRSFLRRRLRPWLNGVHVLPFHPASSDGGFSVLDYAAVDPRFGDWDDVAGLAADGRVMADAVINHMSVGSEWFAGFLRGDPGYRGFFRTAAPQADLAAVVRPRTHPLLTRFEAAGGPVHVWTTFSADQADLDFANPRVLLAILEVLLRYLRHGAQAIRLDAVAFLWKREGTPSLHLPETHAVIRLLRSCLDEIDPGVAFVTETNVPHAENVSYFGDGSQREAQAVYQFSLAPLVLDALLTGDATALARWAADLGAGLPGTTFLNFLASHDGVGVRPAEGLLDGDRIAALVAASLAGGGRVSARSLPDGSTAPYELNCTWYDLMAAGHPPGAARARHLAAHAIALALRGIPLLYVQSLIAASNDPAGFAVSGQNRDLNRQRFQAADLQARLDEPDDRAALTWAALRAMLAQRASSEAFHPEAPQRILDGPPEILAVERRRGEAAARVAVNVSRRTVTVPGLGGAGWVDAAGRPASRDPELGPWEAAWYFATA